MATVISKLSVRIAASADGVRTGVTQAQGYLGRLQQRVDALAMKGYGGLKSMATSTFGQMLSATAAASAATAVWQAGVEGVGNAIERIGEQSDRAQRVGVEQADLARLEYAGKLAGIESDKMGGALAKLQDFVAEAGTLGSSQADTLSQLGLSADDLEGLNASERFLAIGDAIEQINDPAEKVRLSMDIFGRSGAELVPMFDAGRDAIQGAFEEADRLGLTLSETDAAAIAEVGDQMDRLSAAIEGVFNALTAEAAPGMIESLEKISDALIFAKENAESLYNVWYVASMPAMWPIRLIDAAGQAAGAWGETAKEIEEAVSAQEGLAGAKARNQDPDSLARYEELKTAEEAKRKAEKEREDAAKAAIEERLRLEQQAHDELARRAESIRHSLRDPFTEFAAEMVDALDAVDEGVLSQETFDRFKMERGQSLLESLFAEDKAKNRLTDRVDTSGVGSVAFGTQAALSAIAASERGMQAQKAREAEAARQRKQQTQHLSRIVQILENPRRSLESFDIR